MTDTQIAAMPKGLRIFLDYDQEELNYQYDPGKHAPNMKHLFERFEVLSEAARAIIGPPTRLEYGDGENEQLDLYKTTRPNAPVHVFLHGGGWHLRHAKHYGFLAPMFINAGAHFIALDFRGVESTGGTLMPIVQSLRRAIAWVHGNVKGFGGDPDRIYISGHSSGGHLVAALITTDWAKEHKLPANVIKGCIAAGGFYDLAPLGLTHRAKAIKFDEATVAQLSPIRHVDKINADLLVAYGSLESAEMKRQAESFVAAVQKAGKPVRLLPGTTYNHFELTETLSNPYGLLGRAALEQMKLRPPSLA